MAAAMQGRVCLVTGATQGIGRETALGLARLGADVHLVARDRARAEAVLAEVRRAGGGNASLFVADLASQASTRALAEEVKARLPRLHVLVNNAGGIFTERALSPDRIEMTLALNHLGYFLLTGLLVDRLRASAPARVVSVSSSAHVGARIEFDDLQGERGYSGWRAYGQSKLANILFTRELARRLAGSGVTANCLHPGVVATGFGKNNAGPFSWGVRIAAPFFLSAARGARTSIWLASSPEVAGVTGQYFARYRVSKVSDAARDEAAARRLWEVSARLTGLAA
jgi:NAD(P)-dependent dehydrogenase (short-subunit alcohol dehydrogenase family)